MREQNCDTPVQTKLQFETTVNIDRETYARLTEAAKRFGVSKSRLIAMLISRFVQKETVHERAVGTVKYQQSQPPEHWKKLHIVIPAYVCEFFDDVRKLWKLSVSFLVVLVVQKYLAQLCEIFEKTPPDNYWCGAYTSILFEHNDIQFLLFCWGIPLKKPKILII